MVDCAIIADTQWERRVTYQWLEKLKALVPFPIHMVTVGSLRDNILAKQNVNGGRFVSVPFYLLSPRGKKGIGRRQCTREYKLDPVRRKKRELLGYKPRARIPVGSCETLIGISLDEFQRVKPARDRWDRNIHPLVDMGMTRLHCMEWLTKHGFDIPPKSSCIGCPYHDDALWGEIKKDPAEWADALEIDRIIREPVRGQRGQQFMHDERIPLDQVDLLTPRERGQVDGFINECEGMCGV